MFFSALQRFFAATRDNDDVARAFKRVFTSDDGKIVLEHLHNYSFFRVTEPNIPIEQLRFIEGQRQLVLFICQLAAKNQ